MHTWKVGTLVACLIASVGACGGDVADSQDQPSTLRGDDEESERGKHKGRKPRPRKPRDGGAPSSGGSGGASCETPPDAGVAGGGGLSDDGGGGGLAGSGGGGTGGATQCVPSHCPSCGFLGPISCCKSDGGCGCTWFPTYCF